MQNRLMQNIPLELRTYPQYVMWRYEDTINGKPTKVPYCANTGKLANVNNPSTWCSFDYAVHTLSTGWYDGIGFVLADSDPYLFIDLDDPQGDADIFAKQQQIYNDFNSYAELSPSGTGLHIIVKASIPAGRKRGKIEMYSKQRFMTMTGSIYRNCDIREYNGLANALFEQMSTAPSDVLHFLGLEPEKQTDEKIIETAINAANGEKFSQLYNGHWQAYYSSQSEADFALMDIIAYYSHNRAQVVRIFRSSELGQREKAKRDNYINYMINRCFDRQLPPVDLDGLTNKIKEALDRRNAELNEQIEQPKFTVVEKKQVDDVIFPPGLVGQIAQFIYDQSPRQVAEVSLIAALGLVSGIAGRAYNISNTGLNQYILLLAPTGIGKEAIARGINKLMNHVIKKVPSGNDFLGPAEIASAPALIKYMDKGSKSFVSVVGEFGLHFKQMAHENAPPHLVNLRKLLLDLYNKSGEGDTLRATIYSDRDKNTNAILSPAYSLIGESVPEELYRNLDESMIASGLLPRFTIFEYTGDRKPLNKKHAKAMPSVELVENVATLCANASMLNNQNRAVHIGYTPEGETALDEFEAFCTLRINSTGQEVPRNLWTRGHIKALKLAGVISVGLNPYAPIVDLDTANYAIAKIKQDINNMLSRFENGEIGSDTEETKQIIKVVETIKHYLNSPWSDVAKYAGDGFMMVHSERAIPYSYLQRKLASVAVFRKDKTGASNAIKRTIKTLIERGDLLQISAKEAHDRFATSSVCYVIANTSMFVK